MTFTEITSVIFGCGGLIIGFAALKSEQRGWLWQKISFTAFTVVGLGAVGSAVFNFYWFVTAVEPPTRWEIAMLFMHFFNITMWPNFYAAFLLQRLRRSRQS